MAQASAQDRAAAPVAASAPDAATAVHYSATSTASVSEHRRVTGAGDINGVTTAEATALPSATREVYAQRRGGGGGRGGGSRGGATRGGGGRGGWNDGYVVRRAPVYRGGGFGGWGGGFGGSLYFARPYYYDPFWASGAFGWSPMMYAPWSLMWGTAGWGPYPMWGGSTTFNTGALRLRVRPRDAQVFVDGYLAGIVDQFDGTFQSLRLAPGGHKIEVRMPGFETLTFDVHIQPDRTMTITEGMRPNP
ncbi:MAG: PEGA domain-containing protein [Acidobacteria bacterium]|nr:PEGA domain-containing protein [Acidobacteriota bacterium]